MVSFSSLQVLQKNVKAKGAPGDEGSGCLVNDRIVYHMVYI